MKIHISGLGVLPELQISLKPLTVFVGENGTGKTWTAYTIAAIFGDYGFNKYVRAYLQDQTSFRYAAIDETIKDLIEKGSAELNIVEFAKEYTETYINEIAKLAPRWMNSFMASRRVDFSKMSIRAALSESAMQTLYGTLKDLKTKKGDLVGVKEDSSALELNCLKEEGSDHVYFYTKYAANGSGEIPPTVLEEEIKEFVVPFILSALDLALFRGVVIFPTERTTFVTFPFAYNEPEHRRSVKLEEKREARRSRPAGSASEPVNNLIRTLVSCASQYSVREGEAQDPKATEMIELGRFIEDRILLGNISAETQGSQSEIMYSPSEKVSLELTVSSSLVKELTPLALYLRCLAKPGDLIVIDEPEMNLHPAAQVKLTEFLGMLVNAGLHVLITTHSPYIVDHIPNLIRAHDLDKEKVKEYFYLKQATSFLPKDKVAVYLFERDAVTDILKGDGDINWETFSNVSRKLSEIYSNLIA